VIVGADKARRAQKEPFAPEGPTPANAPPEADNSASAASLRESLERVHRKSNTKGSLDRINKIDRMYCFKTQREIL
jgi:hypothetical protein